ncbi:MAG: hypothetical protein HOM46_02345 [Nitrosomonadales bacterium]|jgi:hypothetical protein|nr:hypothetical protein [Nitrosomonadales bacterium]
MKDHNSIKIEAQKLVDEHSKKAVEIAKRKVDNLNNQHSRESDFAFLLLSEVEKLVEEL